MPRKPRRTKAPARALLSILLSTAETYRFDYGPQWGGYFGERVLVQLANGARLNRKRARIVVETFQGEDAEYFEGNPLVRAALVELGLANPVTN